MARPIAETPVLTGSDARRFEEAIKDPTPVSKEEFDASGLFREASKVGA